MCTLGHTIPVYVCHFLSRLLEACISYLYHHIFLHVFESIIIDEWARLSVKEQGPVVTVLGGYLIFFC